MSLAPGTRLGEFVLGERVGSGGFADVFRAHQPSLGREAVVKVLKPQRQARPSLVAAFRREAQLASQLDHPYAAHIYAFGAEPHGVLWIAMELVRGQTLARYIKTHGKVPLAQFAPLFEALCEVVQSAHDAGLIHRDIKPANVMVIRRAGRLMPKLLDFGIAMFNRGENDPPAPPRASRRAHSVDSSWEDDADTFAQAVISSTDPVATESAHGPNIAGTPAYMAPEQWVGSALDHRIDVYALGVLAYESLTGRLPFAEESPRGYWLAHTSKPPPSLGPELPAALDAALARALAKRAIDRTESALELASEVRRATATSQPRQLPRALLGRWLAQGPASIGEGLARLDSDGSASSFRGALGAWVRATSQWIGALALAAWSHAAAPAPPPKLAELARRTFEPSDWLELAAALCSSSAQTKEELALPELAQWLLEDGAANPQSLLAIHALGQSGSDVTAGIFDLLSHVLRTLDFLCDYTVLSERGAAGGEGAADAEVRAVAAAEQTDLWLGDVDRRRLFPLAPLVELKAPLRGEAPHLFAIAGGDGGARMIAYPSGFQLDAPKVAAWLQQRVGPVDEPSPLGDEPRAPYRGLATFSSADASLFFGRQRQVDALLNRLLRQPMLTLTGPSGSGKSSIVYAGILPRLGVEWRVASLRPGFAPLQALERALAQIGANLPAGLGGAGAALEAWTREAGTRVLIFVDQGEELFTMTEAREERERFAALLAELVAHGSERVRVVITLRDDFLRRADELAGWRGALAHNLTLLTAADPGELATMLAAPAAQFGFAFEQGLIDEMVSHVVDQAAALPLLSFTASQLWEVRDVEQQLLTWSAYRRLGGVGGALSRYCEQIYQAMPVSQQHVAREFFRHLVSGQGTRALVERAVLVGVAPEATAVLERLIASRILVTSEGPRGVEYVGLLHEAILNEWPRLVTWRHADASGAQLRDELHAAAELWDARGRDAGYLWRGEALRSLELWRQRWPAPLGAVESEFARASLQVERRGKRRRWQVIVGAFGVLLAALAVLLVSNRTATSNHRRAESRLTELLADRGRGELLAGNSTRALVYLHAAYERGADGPGMRAALALAARPVDRRRARVPAHAGAMNVEAHGAYVFTQHASVSKLWRRGADASVTLHATLQTPELLSATLSPDGALLLTATSDTLTLRDVPQDRVLGTSTTEGVNKGHLVAFLPNQLVATSFSGAIALWDHHLVRQATLGDERVRGRYAAVGALSPSGKHLAATFSDGAFEVWDVERRELAFRERFGSAPATLAYGRDGKVLWVGAPDGALHWLDTETWKPQQTSHPHQDQAQLAVSDDGAWLVTTGGDRWARIWDARRGTAVAALAHQQLLRGAVFSPDRAQLATVGHSGAIAVWNTARFVQTATIEHSTWATFSDDDRWLLAADLDGSLGRWDLQDSSVTRIFAGHQGRVFTARFGPDGARVASLGEDGVRLWDPGSGAQARHVAVEIRAIERPDLAWTSDGASFVATYRTNVQRWDVATGLPLAYFDSFPVVALSVSRRGWVATTNAGQHMGPAGEVMPSYLTVWNVENEEPIVERTVSSDLQHIAFSPMGDELALLRNTELSLWPADLRAPRWTMPVDRGEGLAFSPDGALVAATAGAGRELVLRSTATGAPVQRLVHDSDTHALAFSADGALLAVAADDNLVYLWEVATGRLLATLSGWSSPGRSLDFSPRGTSLVGVDRSSNVLLWDVPREQRSAAALGEMIRHKVPWRLEGVDLVATGVAAPEAVSPAAEGSRSASGAR
ncbi:MAG: protein kinase [Kofleriaceae bacterium]